MVAGFLFSTSIYAQTDYRLTENNQTLRVAKPSLPGELKIFAGDTIPDPSAGIPPMLGKIVEESDSLEFIPTFPFRSEMTYTAAWGDRFLFSFFIPAVEKYPQPEVTAIYPSSATVPANLLKIYLHFSMPMREGVAMNYLFLLDETGDTLPGVFLDLQPELWDHSGQRLTMWFDPGRVKRDLIPNQLLGTPLSPDKSYTILISKDWPDIHGHTLTDDFRKKIQATTPDRQQPDVRLWKITSPEAKTFHPLQIDLGECMDHALLTHAMRVRTAEDKPVAGKIMLGENESVWKFIPDLPWEPGTYKIQVEARLEDLAGNNLNRPFDRDLTANHESQTDKPWFTLEFTIKN